MKKILSSFLFFLFCTMLWAQGERHEIIGTPFVLSEGNGCSIETETAPQKFTFTSQWSATTPTPNSFDAEVIDKIVIEFSEPMATYFNIPCKVDGTQEWNAYNKAGNTNGGVGVEIMEISLEALGGSVTDFSIQHTTNNTDAFTIKRAYSVDKEGNESPIVFAAPGWGGSMQIISETTSGLAQCSSQWGGVNISDDILGLEGMKTLRIYTNAPLTGIPVQWCIKTDEGKDAWPQIGVSSEDPCYAECKIDETLQSIYLQWTSTEAGEIDIKAITWENEELSEDPIIQGTSGTCQWSINDEGMLTIRPTNGTSGKLDSWGNGEAPWYGQRESIVAAKVESGVDAASCKHLFDGCSSLQEVWWEPNVIPADAIGTGTPANMIIYAPEGTETELDYNVVIGGKCDYLKLTEGEPLSISQEFEAEQAVLTRTFSKPTLVEQSAGWESIVVPFDITSIIDEQNRPLAPFGSDKSGTHPFWLAQMSPGGNFTYCTEMKANTPYLISMPNSPLYIDEFNITGEVQFIGENITVKKTSDAQPVEGASMQIVPTYSEIAADGTNLYALNREAFTDDELNEYPAGSVFVSDNTSVALPFEFYVMPKSAPVKGQYIPINIDNVADQLQRLYADTYGTLRIHSENHGLVIQATTPQTIGIYNAQGMHVCTLRLHPGENRTPQLTPGLYVVGKEKYMVK